MTESRDIRFLAELLPILKANQVKSFKDLTLEICFVDSTILSPSAHHISTQDHTIEVPIDESKLPPDLRTDAITDTDLIMNWSASPDASPNQMVGTGDQELTEVS